MKHLTLTWEHNMTQIEMIVEKFLNGNEKKMYNGYATDGKTLVFIDPKARSKDVIAVKFNGVTIGNSSVLELVRRKETGYAKAGVSEIQTLLSTKITMVPFSVFKEAKLDLSKFVLIEKGQEETLPLTKEVPKKDKDGKTLFNKEGNVIMEIIPAPRHFTGACLFKIQNEVYLFDVDRNELVHNIVNPFLVNIADNKVKTIEQAYESLKPQAVKDAESKNITVKRQGEWFFIPTKIDESFVEKNYKKIEQRAWSNDSKKMIYPELILRAGPNRPNIAKLGFEANATVYVKGPIRHSGREHKDLDLKQWHVAIPNTATKSWTVTGDVD